jgi:hypothetical protein
VVLLAARIGDSVVSGTPLAHAWARDGFRDPDTAALQEVLGRSVRLGFERSPARDIAYSLRKVVDIAVRAMSPGINDPTAPALRLGSTGRLAPDRRPAAGGRVAGTPGRCGPRAVRPAPARRRPRRRVHPDHGVGTPLLGGGARLGPHWGVARPPSELTDACRTPRCSGAGAERAQRHLGRRGLPGAGGAGPATGRADECPRLVCPRRPGPVSRETVVADHPAARSGVAVLGRLRRRVLHF